jgi:signal transduction histidine kinase
VLIVDDNDASRYAKTRILQRAGFDVFEAASGRDALDLVARHKPRLVVLDVNLPDVNGMDLCRHIKKQAETASTLVLQVSATYVTHADTVRSLEAGADASLVEPIDPTVLVATAKALLRTRQAEDALRKALAIEQQARSVAESANRAKDEFLATLSHELRSPLSAILTWVTLLRTTTRGDRHGREPDWSQLERGLAAIERNTRHQAKLIEDLLDVSRIMSGKMQLDMAPIDLRSVVSSAVDAVAASASTKGMEITTFIDPELRAIHADASRVQQILSNLLSNAVKFTPPNGRAEVRVLQQPSTVEIQVRDTGIGIESDFLPNVFERFQQADSSSTRPESGLGLGLAIVRHLVELHHGKVEAASEGTGKGATFTVRLPAAPDVQLKRSAAPTAVSNDTSSIAPLAGIHVLVVDDDPDSREAIAAALRAAGAEIGSVDNVHEALERTATQRVDILVSDIGMPREDGFALIRRLREGERTSHLAALALTAYASIGDQRRVLAAGYDGFIAKPAAANELIATVARLARRSKERMQDESGVAR